MNAKAAQNFVPGDRTDPHGYRILSEMLELELIERIAPLPITGLTPRRSN